MFRESNTNGHLRPVSNYIFIIGRLEKTQLKNVIVFVKKNEEDSQIRITLNKLQIPPLKCAISHFLGLKTAL